MQLLSFRKPYEMLPPVPEAQMLTHGFAYQHGTFWRDIDLDDIDPILAQDGTFVWVGLREPSASFLKKIQGKFALHALAVEDAHLAHQRPKVEVYGQSLFVVLHTIELVGSDLHVGELHLFLGRRFVLSICHGTTLNAAQKMQSDGWWLSAEEHPGRDKSMRMRLMREMVGSLVQVPKPLKSFYAEVMRRKKDDHHASHSHVMNQLLHLISSSTFIYCYVLAFSNLTRAMCLGLASLFVRQFGHAVLEPPGHDKEALLLGFNTRNKTLIVLGYLLPPSLHLVQAGSLTREGLTAMTAAVAQQWFLWTIAVVLGRVAYLGWKHNFRTAMIWLVKLVTDPLTDIVAYCSSPFSASKALLPSQARKSAAK